MCTKLDIYVFISNPIPLLLSMMNVMLQYGNPIPLLLSMMNVMLCSVSTYRYINHDPAFVEKLDYNYNLQEALNLKSNI